MKIIIFLACLAGGFVLIRNSKWIVDATSIRFGYVENFMHGGSYSVWKLIGLGLMVFGFWYILH